MKIVPDKLCLFTMITFKVLKDGTTRKFNLQVRHRIYSFRIFVDLSRNYRESWSTKQRQWKKDRGKFDGYLHCYNRFVTRFYSSTNFFRVTEFKTSSTHHPSSSPVSSLRWYHTSSSYYVHNRDGPLQTFEIFLSHRISFLQVTRLITPSLPIL